MKWISIKTRLPKRDKEVLVRIVYGEKITFGIDYQVKPILPTYGTFENGIHVEHPILNQWNYNNSEHVTHWATITKTV